MFVGAAGVALPVTPEKLVGQKIQPTIGADAAAFLDVLVRACRPKRILEIGTSYGYAACVLGLAASDVGGHVTTLEINPVLADAARENARALGLSGNVTVITGNAQKIVPTLDGQFGLILQDGGKLDYLPLLEPLLALLEPRGLLITDDVAFPAMQIPDSVRHWQAAMAEYNNVLQQRKDLMTVWLPMGDGVAVSIKL